MKTALLSLAAIASLLLATQAPADTTQCINIQSVPITISVQGVYCLKQNLQMSATQADAITIAVNNVTIDFNGFKLGGLVAGPNSNSVGVRATDKKNVVLRNASIRGFSWGIAIVETTRGASTGHLIEKNSIEGSRVTGIEVMGSEVVVRENRIVKTGGGFANTIGFRGTNLTNSEVVDNFIADTMSSALEAYGIHLSGASRILVARNTILDTRGQTFVSGIRSHGQTGTASFEDNIIISGVSPIFTYGIRSVGTSLCRNNTVSDYAMQTTGCTVEEGTFPTP